MALQMILSQEDNDSPEVKSPGYEYVLLLNTDAGIDEQSLQELISSLKKDQKVGIAGPVIVDRIDRQHILAAGGVNPALHINTYAPSLKMWVESAGLCEVDYVSGTAALLRTDVLLKTGLFDEDYFFSCEMADLCLRVKKQGYKCVITPQARAWHDMSEAGSQRDTLYMYYSLRNRFLFIRKFYRTLMPVLFCFWALVGGYSMLKALLHKRYQSFRALRLALKDGLMGTYGGRNFLFERTD